MEGRAEACLLGDTGGKTGWIKGPPVLRRMINDLYISGGKSFRYGNPDGHQTVIVTCPSVKRKDEG